MCQLNVPAGSADFQRKLNEISLFDWVFVITGGLVFALPAAFWFGEQKLSEQSPIHWYYWMNATISAPHVYATYVRLSRKTFEGVVPWMAGVPCYVAILGGLTACSQFGYFTHAMTAINVWQSFHYLRQTYGVGSFYSRTAGSEPALLASRYWAYHLVMPALILGRWDTLFTVWQGTPSTYIIPVHVPDALLSLCWGAAFTGLSLGLYAEAKNVLTSSQKVLALFGLVNFAIYVGIHFFGFVCPGFYQRGFFAVTIFHAVQYLALVWKLERARSHNPAISLLSFSSPLPGFLVFWGVIFVLGYGLETVALDSVNRWWPNFATLALSAISAHHYTVDGVMWRKSSGA